MRPSASRRPIIVLIGRLLQGFSAGVELGGVSVYLSEIATPGNRGFYTSFQSSSQQVAIFVAAIIGFILSEAMPADTSWLPSADRNGASRSSSAASSSRSSSSCAGRWRKRPNSSQMKKHPTAIEVFASAIANWRIVVLGMMIAVLTTTTFYFVTVYTPDLRQERAEPLDRRTPCS